MSDRQTPTKPPAGSLIGVWLAVFFAYALTVGGHMYSPDDEALFRTTEALATRGELAIEPIAGGFASRPGAFRDDGREYAQYGVGQPILAVPFYYAGRLLERVYRGGGLKHEKPINRIVEMQYHDRGDAAWVRRFAVSWFNAALGATFAAGLFAFAWALTRERAAAWMTALLYALGTMAWPQARTFFSEPLAAFCVMASFGLLWRSTRPGGAWPSALAAGAFAGYAILTRLDSVFALPGPAVFLLLANDRVDRRERRWFDLVGAQFRGDALRRWIAWVTPIVGAVGVYAALNLAHFGDLTPAYADQAEGISFGTPLLVGLHGFLFSIGRGLFFFSPPLILFFWSIRRFLRGEPALGWGLVVSIALFLGVQSTWINWSGGWCWGPRHIFMIHWMLALPVAALLARRPRAGVRVAYGALMALGVAAQIYGSSVSFSKFYKVHYYDVFEPPKAMSLFSPEQEPYLRQLYDLRIRTNPYTEPTEPQYYFASLIAPINDSVHVYQNSQWAGNRRCLERGLHDFFWMHLYRSWIWHKTLKSG